MSGASYVPDRGDLVWLSFNPQAGREQAGRRPALIISPIQYNAKAGLTLACPVTNQAKGYPFEVAVPPGLPVTGVILADHLKSLDWRVRRAEFICQLPEAALTECLGKLGVLVG